MKTVFHFVTKAVLIIDHEQTTEAEFKELDLNQSSSLGVNCKMREIVIHLNGCNESKLQKT